MSPYDHYPLLARLFRYPDDALTASLEELGILTARYYPSVSGFVSSFAQGVLSLSQHEREELFIRTFDVEPVCHMDIGHILFGEDYKRGDFLAQMQREQTAAGNDPGTELADHLPNVLTLIPLLGDEGLVAELGWCILVPAVTEILKKFESTANYYRFAFETLRGILTIDFSRPDLAQFTISQAGPEFCGAENYACGSDFLSETRNIKF